MAEQQESEVLQVHAIAMAYRWSHDLAADIRGQRTRSAYLTELLSILLCSSDRLVSLHLLTFLGENIPELVRDNISTYRCWQSLVVLLERTDKSSEGEVLISQVLVTMTTLLIERDAVAKYPDMLEAFVERAYSFIRGSSGGDDKPVDAKHSPLDAKSGDSCDIGSAEIQRMAAECLLELETTYPGLLQDFVFDILDTQAPLPMPRLLYDLCMRTPPRAVQTTIILLATTLTHSLSLAAAAARAASSSPPLIPAKNKKKLSISSEKGGGVGRARRKGKQTGETSGRSVWKDSFDGEEQSLLSRIPPPRPQSDGDKSHAIAAAAAEANQWAATTTQDSMMRFQSEGSIGWGSESKIELFSGSAMLSRYNSKRLPRPPFSQSHSSSTSGHASQPSTPHSHTFLIPPDCLTNSRKDTPPPLPLPYPVPTVIREFLSSGGGVEKTGGDGEKKAGISGGFFIGQRPGRRVEKLRRVARWLLTQGLEMLSGWGRSRLLLLTAPLVMALDAAGKGGGGGRGLVGLLRRETRRIARKHDAVAFDTAMRLYFLNPGTPSPQSSENLEEISGDSKDTSIDFKKPLTNSPGNSQDSKEVSVNTKKVPGKFREVSDVSREVPKISGDSKEVSAQSKGGAEGLFSEMERLEEVAGLKGAILHHIVLLTRPDDAYIITSWLALAARYARVASQNQISNSKVKKCLEVLREAVSPRGYDTLHLRTLKASALLSSYQPYQDASKPKPHKESEYKSKLDSKHDKLKENKNKKKKEKNKSPILPHGFLESLLEGMGAGGASSSGGASFALATRMAAMVATLRAVDVDPEIAKRETRLILGLLDQDPEGYSKLFQEIDSIASMQTPKSTKGPPPSNPQETQRITTSDSLPSVPSLLRTHVPRRGVVSVLGSAFLLHMVEKNRKIVTGEAYTLWLQRYLPLLVRAVAGGSGAGTAGVRKVAKAALRVLLEYVNIPGALNGWQAGQDLLEVCRALLVTDGALGKAGRVASAGDLTRLLTKVASSHTDVDIRDMAGLYLRLLHTCTGPLAASIALPIGSINSGSSSAAPAPLAVVGGLGDKGVFAKGGGEGGGGVGGLNVGYPKLRFLFHENAAKIIRVTPVVARPGLSPPFGEGGVEGGDTTNMSHSLFLHSKDSKTVSTAYFYTYMRGGEFDLIPKVFKRVSTHSLDVVKSGVSTSPVQELKVETLLSDYLKSLIPPPDAEPKGEETYSSHPHLRLLLEYYIFYQVINPNQGETCAMEVRPGNSPSPPTRHSKSNSSQETKRGVARLYGRPGGEGEKGDKSFPEQMFGVMVQLHTTQNYATLRPVTLPYLRRRPASSKAASAAAYARFPYVYRFTVALVPRFPAPSSFRATVLFNDEAGNTCRGSLEPLSITFADLLLPLPITPNLRKEWAPLILHAKGLRPSLASEKQPLGSEASLGTMGAAAEKGSRLGSDKKDPLDSASPEGQGSVGPAGLLGSEGKHSVGSEASEGSAGLGGLGPEGLKAKVDPVLRSIIFELMWGSILNGGEETKGEAVESVKLLVLPKSRVLSRISVYLKDYVVRHASRSPRKKSPGEKGGYPPGGGILRGGGMDDGEVESISRNISNFLRI
ncbi:hypothetical protein AAMO2058_000001800 [Amorphochlora amoebiformis]